MANVNHKITIGPVWCGCCGWAMEPVTASNFFHCVNPDCEIFARQYQLRLYVNEVSSVGQRAILGVKEDG
jgi:hypothetical protein